MDEDRDLQDPPQPDNSDPESSDSGPSWFALVSRDLQRTQLQVEALRSELAFLSDKPASSHGRPAAASASEADINRMLFEAQVSAIPDALPMLPWETGLFKNIFQDNMGVDVPVFKMPVPLAVPETIRPPPVPATTTRSGKRVHACLFHSCNAKYREDSEATEEELAPWVPQWVCLKDWLGG